MPIGAVQTASGYEVAWEIPGANEYTLTPCMHVLMKRRACDHFENMIFIEHSESGFPRKNATTGVDAKSKLRLT